MPIVQMPDGALVELPDNPSPELKEAVRQKIAGMPAASAPAQPAGMGESVVRSLAKGFGNAAAAAPDALSLLPMSEEASGNFRQTAQDTRDFWNKVGAPSTLPKYPKAAVEGVGGAAAGGGMAAPIRNSVAGAAGGIGGEAAATAYGEGPLQRGLGSLAGGLVGGMAGYAASRARPQTAELAQEALEGLPPQKLQEAKAFMQQADAQGVQMDLAQALHAVGVPEGTLTRIRDTLNGSKHGNAVQSILRAQPAELEIFTDQTVGKLPGRVYGKEQVANNLQEAATDRLTQAKQARTAQVRSIYEKAPDLPPEARQTLLSVAQRYANQPGATEALKKEAATLIAKIKGASPELTKAQEQARQALVEAKGLYERVEARKALAEINKQIAEAGNKPLRAADVDTWISEAVGPYKGSPISPPDPKTLGQIKGFAKEMNAEFQKASPEVARAEQTFARISRETVDPLKQSSVGTMATPRGYRPDTQASVAKFDALMRAGTDPSAKTSNIRTLGRELAKVDPQAVPDAVKTYVSGVVGKAFEPTFNAGQVSNADAARKIQAALFDNKLQWQGLQDAVAVSAQSMGKNPTEVVRGLKNYAMIVKGLSNRPGRAAGMQEQQIIDAAGKSLPAEALRSFGWTPFARAGARVQDAVMGRTLRDFDKILSTPEGADMLVELAKVPPMSNKAVAIIGAFGGGQAGEDQ